jgi:outer membrane receptor protein involved in Fe transport
MQVKSGLVRAHAIGARPVGIDSNRSYTRVVAVLAAALWLGVAPSSMQAQAALPHTVRGTIFDVRSNAGVAAELLVDGVAVARADSAGRFSIALPRRAGTAAAPQLRVRAIGYRQVTVTLPAAADSVRSLDIPLTPLVLALASMQTVAQREERAAFGEVPATGALAFTSGELRHTPALGDRDVLRVVALLPGIATRNDLSSSFNVRGGEADQNLVLLDGVPIYNPFHFGGLFGTFIDATVGRVEVLTGGFPSEYGGRLSSVLEVRSAEETRPGVHATTDLSVLASSARLAGALAQGRVAWSVAGRRTYADKLIELMRGRNEFP